VSNIPIIRATPAGRLRTAARAGAVVAMTSVPLLAANTVLAATSNHNYQGEDSGPGLTVLQTLGIYVAIPLGLFLVISFLVVLPGWVKGDRNRNAVGWSKSNRAATSDDAAQKVTADTASGTGGASGSW
jgi:hypothetical protein